MHGQNHIKTELSFVLFSSTFLCQQYKAYLCLHTKCLIYLSYIKKRLPCTDFRERLHFQISRNFAQ